MSQEAEFQRAFFTIVSPPPESRVEVHFNPTTLSYQIANTLQSEGEGAPQFVAQSTGKLSMDLIYDTSGDGQDVRNFTVQVAKMMEPRERVPPLVRFEWGAYTFEGIVESYKETIDFFSPSGVPLRAGVNLTLAAKQEVVFAGGSSQRMDVGGGLGADAVELFTPAPLGGGSKGSPFSIAMQAGAPGAARALAALNGAESLRFATGGSLVASASVQLGGPVAFSAGGAAGFGAGVSVGGGISLGGSAAAGQGALPRFGLDQLVRQNATAQLSTDRNASFGVGGSARIQGSASLRANVGGRIRFQEG